MMKISKKTRDILAYIIGGTVVFVGTILLIAIATGWQYDIKTGELSETGLILMSSEPAGASITLNDKPLKATTNYRYQNAALGTYTIGYQKPNFRPWKAAVDVTAGEVSFADYAWLLPNEIPKRQRYANSPLTTAVQSQDRKRFIFIEQTLSTSESKLPPRLLTSVDLTKAPVLLLDPNAVSTLAGANITSLDALQLSTDGSQLLFRATYSDGSPHWLSMPTNPSSSPVIRDITKDFTIAPSWITWFGDSNTDLSYIEKSSLKRLQLREGRISEALATNVAHANWSDDKLVFITQSAPENAPELFIRLADGTDNRRIAALTKSNASYATRYFNSLDRDYIAVLGGDEKTITLFSNILRNTNDRSSSVIARNATTFTVNPTGRFLVHNSNNTLITIDFERYRRYRNATSLAGLTNWSWMNDQHLAMIQENNLRLVDFDGQNNELLLANIAPSAPILFSENKSLLTFTKSTATTNQKLELQHLFLNPDRILE